MRIAGSVVVLIMGIAVLLGVFLTWLDVSFGPFGAFTDSGWNLFMDFGVSDATEPFLAFLGGVIMIGCGLVAFIVSMSTKGGRAAVMTMGIISSIAGLVAVGGALWYIIDALANDVIDVVGYGVYISIVAALVGFTFAIITAATSGPRAPARAVRRPAPAPASVEAAAAPAPAAHPPPPPPPPAPEPEPVVEEAVEEPAPVLAEEAPVAEEAAEEPVAEVAPVEEVTEEAAPAAAAAAAPVAEEKKPAPKRAKSSPAGKPEGVDESTLPMVQQSWETSAEFKARKKRVKSG
jgi:outer membrane biosynthesis protein TonB